jgi:hypothetical protein
VLLDDFAAADADPMGAPWADFIPFYGTGGLRRSTGSAMTTGGTANRRGMQHETATYTETEFWARMAVVPTTAAQRVDLWVRAGDRNLSSQYAYGLQVIEGSPDTWRMVRRSGGATTTLSSDVSGPSIADGDDLGIECTGTGATVTLKAYHRPAAGSWTLIGTWTDSTGSRLVAAGYVGIGFGDGATEAEEVYVGEIGGGSMQTILPDADVTTTGWTATPLHSKLADSSDATVITATAS